MTYEERLEDGGLATLKERRKRGDMIKAFKMLSGINNIKKDSWFQIAENEIPRPSTRANTTVEGEVVANRLSVLVRERARTNLRNNCFRLRVERAWNDLPDGVRQAKSTNSFKTSDDNWCGNIISQN